MLLNYLNKKTGKYKRFPITPMLRGLINKYVLGKNDEQWLFKSQKGEAVLLEYRHVVF